MQTVHILLVDDDESHLALIRRAFVSNGQKFTFSTANSLAEARRFLQTTSPNLMIVDFLLPDGKGLELLPGSTEKRVLPIIILTGQGDEKIATAAIKAGAMDYIVKSSETFADMPHIIERTLREWKHITELKQAESMVKKLSHAIAQSGESVVITDRQGIIEYVNPAFEKITGYSAAEAIGQTPRLLKSGEQDAAFYENMWKTISHGHTWHGKIIDRRKDGSFYPAMLSISPVYDESGHASSRHCSHYVGIQSDLSEFENLENQFHQAQKMEAIGTLVGGIAHDFNNMLAGMAGNLYLAKKRLQGMPDAVEKLNNVEAIAFRAADMIQQLLIFARKGRISVKPIPFTPFIKETIKFLHTSIPENITVCQDICSESLQINGDATQIHQVLMNLMNNARDAVEHVENPCISIRLEALHADAAFIETHAHFKIGDYAHLSVEDSGCGIPEDRIEHLFEPFFTTKEQGKGTGLGLAMVFGAIKTHHGFVEVESVEGKGSSFHIYLPLLVAEDVVRASPRKQDVAEGHGEVILLVDDQPQIVETGKEVLESICYQVITATDGQQAVEIFKARAEGIDLVILDVVMPVMGGGVAAQCIRQIDPHAKIILSTGYDKDSRTDMDNEAVLSKPFSIAEMSQLIRQQLDGSEAI